MKRLMRKPREGRRLLFGKKNKRDDRGSAIVIVIIAMALIGILATTILWASYLNYRIKVNDLRVKNSFYSAETVIEQILAGVKKDVASSVNEAYQDVVSNWDALGTDANRESYFLTAYIERVEERLYIDNIDPAKTLKSRLEGFVDAQFWIDGNPQGYIDKDKWDGASLKFMNFDEVKAADPKKGGTMLIRNICVEFYDSDGLLSIINTDIAIDVPKLSFTQAGSIDRLYPYVLVGGEGITTETGFVNIDGSIYGGVDDHNEGGIQIGQSSHVTVENAAYIISGGDIVVGNSPDFLSLVNQDAELVVRDLISNGVGFRTNVYANGLAVNSGFLSVSGKMYVANDLTLSGKGSTVNLAGQYLGYGDVKDKTYTEPGVGEDGSVTTVNVNPAGKSSAIVINGKNSTVDLTGLNTLLLAGRAYVSLSDDDDTSAKPHILMGESISVKSNQIAYLVPPECVGTLGDGRVIIGQNPMPDSKWSQMLGSLSEYAGQDFKIVDAGKDVVKLGGLSLVDYGIGDLDASVLDGIDPDNIAEAVTRLNIAAAGSNIRFYHMQSKEQVYLYLAMDEDNAERYFADYYKVNDNKNSLVSYFNQYASGGIRLKENVQGYTVVGNSMVSDTRAANGDNIATDEDGENLVKLLSSVMPRTDEDGEGEDEEDDLPADPDAYEEVSDDNVTSIENIRESEIPSINNNYSTVYRNLNKNLSEEDPGTEDTVFGNLIMLETPAGSAEGVVGLEDYLKNHGYKVEFETSDGLKAVLVDTNRVNYTPKGSDRLVIAVGDIEVRSAFQGLIIASGKITVSNGASCKKNGEDVYKVLQATDELGNTPAQILRNGSGMVENGYEGTETDELGNMIIDYSKIVRYENWIKK